MRKLKLDIDQLAVESFEPSTAPKGEGTVVGHNTGALGYTCNGCATNRDVCGGDYGGGTMELCTYAPTMNPALFECYSMAYCIATKPCP